MFIAYLQLLINNEIMEALFVVVIIGGFAFLAFHEFKLYQENRKAQHMFNDDKH